MLREQPELVIQFIHPGPRNRPVRRRATALAVILGVALAGGLIGQLAARKDMVHPAPPSLLGYFPT